MEWTSTWSLAIAWLTSFSRCRAPDRSSDAWSYRWMSQFSWVVSLLSLALTWLTVGLGDAPAAPAEMSSPAALSIAAAANTPRRTRGDRMSRRVPTW
jgi:hypothetical protein